MPSINYFHPSYKREEPRTDAKFGIGDDGKLAFTTFDEEKTVVEVWNEARRSVQFTPIDHNVVVMENGNERSQCDGMLHIPATMELIFVEMKTGERKWVTEAVEQLESTINHFAANHVVTDFKKRSAYAANNRYPYFQSSKMEMCEAFRARPKFRLNITNRIVIK